MPRPDKPDLPEGVDLPGAGHGHDRRNRTTRTFRVRREAPASTADTSEADSGPVNVVLSDPVAGSPSSEETVAESQRLRAASVHGVIVSVGSEALKFGLRFAYQILMARLLLPRDFGLVAMAAPAVAFIQLFADLGLTEATIQHKAITQAQLSFLFWVNLAAGLALAGICVAAAPLVAWFYHQPEVGGVMMATGGVLALSGLFSQHLALMTRHMRFRALAVVDLSAFLLGAVAGVAAARLGAGYWALIINQAVWSITTVAIAWAISRWVPGWPGKPGGVRGLLQFGGNVTAFRFMHFFSRNSDNILIGRFCGEFDLGLYDRAFKLTLLPFTQVSVPFTKVAIPLLSRSNEQPEFYRKAYSRMLEALLLLLYPGLVFLLSNSFILVTSALGARWAGIVPIFKLLGIDAFVAPVAVSMGWLFISQGRAREMRDWSVLTSILFIAGFTAGLRWGPRGVAGGYAGAGLLEMTFLWHIATRTGPLRGRDFWAVLLPFLFSLAITFAVVVGVGRLLPAGAGGLALSFAVSYASFVTSLGLLPRGRSLLGEIWRQGFRRLRGFRRTHSPGWTAAR